MRSFTSLPRPVLLTLAVLFAAATVLYSALWMYAIRWEPEAELGLNFFVYRQSEGTLRIAQVLEGGPAEGVGLQKDDRILAINGQRLDNPEPFYDKLMHGRPGDVVNLTVEHPGAPDPLQVEVVLEPPGLRQPPQLAPTQRIALELTRFYPILFLAVGLPVLFLRLKDRNAWLLALLFGAFIAAAPVLELEGRFPSSLRGFALAYSVTLGELTGPLFYFFFAVFPVASALDRRLPWLKWVLLVGPAAVGVALGLSVLLAGNSQPVLALTDRLGETGRALVWALLTVGAVGLGLASLVWNSLRAPTADVRRKARVVLWGTVAGVTPAVLLQAASIVLRRPIFSFPFWVWVPSVLALLLLPLSFGYAVLKYRVLEIPVLLRRSARYLLVQRGFTFLIVLASLAATLLFGFLFARFVLPRMEFAVPASVGFGVAFGLLLAWAGVQVEKRVSERIDRAFFRSAYDARQILEDLAEKARTVTSRTELGALLQRNLIQALQPSVLVAYLEASEGLLVTERSRVLPGLELIPTTHPLVEEAGRRGQPWDLPLSDAKDAPDLSLLAPLNPECLVPIRGRQDRLTGLIVLGPRLSEEPYSGEDKRLLASAASQAGIALESIRLAETIAERMEAERRVAQEIAIAKQVQEKLLPQKAPPMATLDYTGTCIQARTVGGDYYDFLDLGPGRLGLVLADISGKGISAALLMAHLQANLRSQYALAMEDPLRLLQSVNRLFRESTDPGRFATAFFASYEEATHRVRYANCGHNPPLLLRADGRVEWLGGTAMVLGLFEDWTSTVEEVQLAAGDILVIYTDGVTEAKSDEGEDFGEQRLLEAVRANSRLAAAELLDKLATTVQIFSGSEQEDDLTLLVARVR